MSSGFASILPQHERTVVREFAEIFASSPLPFLFSSYLFGGVTLGPMSAVMPMPELFVWLYNLLSDHRNPAGCNDCGVYLAIGRLRLMQFIKII